MLEETSTSASAGAMASVEDLFWSKTAGNPSVDVSTPSNAAEIHFSSRNPRIEETRGLMHLYRDAAAPLSFSLPECTSYLGLYIYMLHSERKRRPATCSLLQIYSILDLLSTHSLPPEALESNLLVQFVLVCRYCQQQPEKSIVMFVKPQTTSGCVISGSVGCGRYKDGHAVSHWKETQHCYSLELETQRVWDYVGDNYVHRLIQSKTDGKLVELNSHCTHKDDGCGHCIGYGDTVLDSDVESIVNKYNELLTSQLENQKNINDNLLRNQSIWESKIDNIEEREKKLLKLKDKKIEELEEQLRTLMESLEAANVEEQKRTGQHPTTSTELKDEIVAGPIDSSTKGATKMTARGKSKG